MPIDFFKLPPKAMSKVFSHLNDTSVLRIREVSKFTQEAIQILMKTRKSNFKWILAYQNGGQYPTKIVFQQFKAIPIMLFKLAFISASRKLAIPIAAFQFRNFVLYEFNAILKWEEVERFLQYIQPFVQGAEHFDTHNVQSELLDMSLLFLEGKTVGTLRISLNLSSEDYIPSYELLGKVRTERIEYTMSPLKKDSLDFIMHLADTMKDITIQRGEQEFSGMIPIIHEILSRKCEKLHLDDPFFLLSSTDMEDLLQFLNHLEKKVSFTTKINISVANNTTIFGVYKLQVNRHYSLTIEHLEFDV